jgi:hypothetical protein
MLGVVGIESDQTSEFLIRTEGVALVAMAVLVRFVPIDGGSRTRGALIALAGYLILGSLVDLRAFVDGIVGPAAVPSAAVRMTFGVICVVLAASAARQRATLDASMPEGRRGSADRGDLADMQ